MITIKLSPQTRDYAFQKLREAPEGHVITIKEPTRNLDQNAALWPLLEAYAEQLEWPVNGAMTKLDADDWKAILSAAYRNETTRVAQGLNGGMVLIGHKTSKFSVQEFSEFLDFIQAEGIRRGVKFDRRVNVHFM